MDLKQVYENMKVHLCIDKEIRDLFSEYLNLGSIVRIISRNREKYSTCDPSLPSEYFSKDNIVEEFQVLTNNNREFLIKEEYLGLNFEAPCDKYVLTIFDKEKSVVASTEDLDKYLEDKKQAKQKRKGKRK